VELRITSPVDGTPLPVGEVGEILVRSPAMMRGYWHDEALTATVIDDKGFLHTGDLGTLDEAGNVRIVGRLKEMYIRGGYNVYPAEVEAALSEHPGIAQAAVVGAPDDVLGQIGVAFVVPADRASQPTLDEVREWCRARIADYKAPDRLVVLDELPLNATHKVDKQALLELEDA
jgi:acyl-CoA synthetase (AMP-forming)/AMP-acid ligase II